MEDYCLACQVPYSRDGTRRYCIYCSFSKDPEVKQQSVTYTATGTSYLYKIPSFKRILKASVRVQVDSLVLSKNTEYDMERIGPDAYIRFVSMPKAGATIYIEWEDFKG